MSNMAFIIDIKYVGLASNRLSKHILPDFHNASLCGGFDHVLPKELILLTPTRYQYHHPNDILSTSIPMDPLLRSQPIKYACTE